MKKKASSTIVTVLIIILIIAIAGLGAYTLIQRNRSAQASRAALPAIQGQGGGQAQSGGQGGAQ